MNQKREKEKILEAIKLTNEIVEGPPVQSGFEEITYRIVLEYLLNQEVNISL